MLFLLHQAVDVAAERRPDHVAVRYSGQSLSYAALAQRSSALARTLLSKQVCRGDRVGIFMNKSLDSAAAIHGIMKAGGAYVPLDPFAPVSRIALVIRDCGIRHLVTTDLKLEQTNLLAQDTGELAYLIGAVREGFDSTSWEDATSDSSETPELGLTEQDLAYILYTSGSTGTPKGIMHTHRSGLSFAEWAVRTYGLSPQDRISNHAPLHFDLSTLDFFAAAVAGATTVIIPEAITRFPASLSRLMVDEKLTVWYSTPFALIQLMERGALEQRDLSTLRWILFAGEVFPTKHLRRLMDLFPEVAFSNLYGPTETNVCTFYNVPPLPRNLEEAIPIGIPCENTEALVMGEDDRAVSSGEIGELLIRGGTVMRGYWGHPDLNQRGFYRRRVLGGHYEDLFYRTGDLVQEMPDGNLKYLGRKDRQIKTRGYRVELDEVEVALLSCPDVEEAAAFPIEDGQGSNLIFSAVTVRDGGQLTSDTVLNHVADRLPPYAVPAAVRIMDSFPRTSTGKINRRELQSQASSDISVT